MLVKKRLNRIKENLLYLPFGMFVVIALYEQQPIYVFFGAALSLAVLFFFFVLPSIFNGDKK